MAEGSGRFARMAAVRLMNCDWRHRRLDEVRRARLACLRSLYLDARLHRRCLYAGWLRVIARLLFCHAASSGLSTASSDP